MVQRVPVPVAQVVASALGREHRADPVVGRTGGPAGNAKLTAWVGLLLLVAFFVEGVTLLSLGSMIVPHIVVGALLIALVLAKTATTGWRILRYYLRSPAYRRAGPPPLLLRVLGPLVVVGSFAVLGSGVALVVVGRHAHDPLFAVAGFRVDPVTIHQATFILWFAVTAPHVLARTVPAAQIAIRGNGLLRRSGAAVRGAAVAATIGVGVVAAVWVLDAAD